MSNYNPIPPKTLGTYEWTKHAASVRAKHPRAALKGWWKEGVFLGWVVVASHGAALSGLHQDDEEAWADAARRVS